MTDEENEIRPGDGKDSELAELAERITRRLESGEALKSDDFTEVSAACAGSVRGILPTIQALVLLGDQMARAEGSRTRLRKKEDS